MYVIIGAGTIGLYTALQLKALGLENIIIYDPRAGIYTRPGNLSKSILTSINTLLSLNLLVPSTSLHIKTLERILYAEAIRRGISIEKKTFIRLQKDPQNPGVIVANTNKEEEFIATNYVFDCSGTQRAVIHQANMLISPPPFSLTTLTEPLFPAHFLAYVSIPQDTQLQLRKAFSEPLEALSPLTYLRSLRKLIDLGWLKPVFPQGLIAFFGKNKACLYLNAPSDLQKKDYDNWVQTLLECYLPSSSYKHLPPSRKYDSKPRFVLFSLSAQMLNQSFYKGEHLPTILALGDAQIDANYHIGHGISNGIKRINFLPYVLTIHDGEIASFNSTLYENLTTTNLQQHSNQLLQYEKKQELLFEQHFQLTFKHLTAANSLSLRGGERLFFEELLIELRIWQELAVTKKNLSLAHRVSLFAFHSLLSILSMQKVELLELYTSDLPVAVNKKRDLEDYLIWLAWNLEILTTLSHYDKAQKIAAHRHVISIYGLPTFRSKYNLERIYIYSSLIVIFKELENYRKVINLSYKALALFEFENKTTSVLLHKAIILNCFYALYFQAKAVLLEDKDKAFLIYLEAKDLLYQTQSSAKQPYSFGIAVNETLRELGKNFVNYKPLHGLSMFNNPPAAPKPIEELELPLNQEDLLSTPSYS